MDDRVNDYSRGNKDGENTKHDCESLSLFMGKGGRMLRGFLTLPHAIASDLRLLLLRPIHQASLAHPESIPPLVETSHLLVAKAKCLNWRPLPEARPRTGGAASGTMRAG